MEVNTDKAQEITDIIHDIISFFTNQKLSSYALILIFAALAVFTILYIIKIFSLTKHCYKDVDHKGFTKINILNLLSVLLCSQINMTYHIAVNIYLGLFFIPIIVWFVFMCKLFVLNAKRYKNKKNFVKNKKMQADIGKQIGVGHRISRNDLNAVYQTSNVYEDCQPTTTLEGQEFHKRRINKKTLNERKD